MGARSFLLDLLKDKDAHDNFLLQQAGPKRFRRVSGIIVLTQKHLRIVQTRGSRLGGPRFQLTYQQACLVHGTKQGARGPRERFVYCHRTLTLEELERYLVPRYYASCLDAIITRRPSICHLPQCPPVAATAFFARGRGGRARQPGSRLQRTQKGPEPTRLWALESQRAHKQ